MIELRIKSIASTSTSSTQIRLRCSACHHKVMLETLPGMHDLAVNVPNAKVGTSIVIYGIRRCPDPDCQACAFVVFNSTTKSVIASFPPERVDFDSANIPPIVLRSMDEAIACHSNQFDLEDCFWLDSLVPTTKYQHSVRDAHASMT